MSEELMVAEGNVRKLNDEIFHDSSAGFDRKCFLFCFNFLLGHSATEY